MRELITRTWCDNHHDSDDEDDRRHGSTYRVAVGRLPIKEIDLCDECYNAMLKPLDDLVRLKGQPIPDTNQTSKTKRPKPPGSASKAKPADGPCPDCGAVFDTNQGVAMHRNRMHGYTAERSRRSRAKNPPTAQDFTSFTDKV